LKDGGLKCARLVIDGCDAWAADTDTRKRSYHEVSVSVDASQEVQRAQAVQMTVSILEAATRMQQVARSIVDQWCAASVT